MRLQNVVLEPFGAFSRLCCQFAPGLNVVVGPNEAGKTTLVNAIYAALFVPPGVKRNSQDWKNIISPALPYPDGDTARVAIELVQSKTNEKWQLCCAWGAEKRACLLTPHGTEIAGEEALQKALSALLRFGRGTYEKIFLARQDELLKTLDRLHEDREALGTVADVLRTVVLQAAGISVDEVAQKLAEKQKELENNWDLERDFPRDGRDIDNPHRRNVGKILAQYYQVRVLQQKLQEARKAEENLAQAAERLQEVKRALQDVAGKEKELAALERDMQQRNALEPQLETCNLKLEQLKAVMQQWPQKAERLKYLLEKKQEREKKLKELTQELEAAEKEQEKKRKRKIYKNAAQLVNQLNEITAEIAKLPPVTSELIEELIRKEKLLTGLKAEISGMKLRIKFTAKNEMVVKIRSALAGEIVRQVRGESIFAAQGLFCLESGDWSVNVQAGEKDVEALLAELETLETDLKKQLEDLGLSDMEEARRSSQKLGELLVKAETLQMRLEEVLQGHDFRTLETEIKQAGAERPVRELMEIRTDIAGEELSLKELAREIEELQHQLQVWQVQYENPDKVLEEMVALKSTANKIRETLQQLAPLPAAYRNVKDFLQELAALREEKERLGQELLDAREQQLRVESNLPEESPEEICKALQAAEKKLQELKEEAKALRVVAEEFYLLKEQLDAETFLPLHDAFIKNLSTMTGARYNHAQMQGALPEKIALAAGRKALPLELLSCGTLSGVALALRLAMAQCLLQGEEGFLVMDDPLVDLDPERKKAAAKVLQAFAETNQLIITTCDPQTAVLLGGRQINLEPALG